MPAEQHRAEGCDQGRLPDALLDEGDLSTQPVLEPMLATRLNHRVPMLRLAPHKPHDGVVASVHLQRGHDQPELRQGPLGGAPAPRRLQRLWGLRARAAVARRAPFAPSRGAPPGVGALLPPTLPRRAAHRADADEVHGDAAGILEGGEEDLAHPLRPLVVQELEGDGPPHAQARGAHRRPEPLHGRVGDVLGQGLTDQRRIRAVVVHEGAELRRRLRDAKVPVEAHRGVAVPPEDDGHGLGHLRQVVNLQHPPQVPDEDRPQQEQCNQHAKRQAELAQGRIPSAAIQLGILCDRLQPLRHGLRIRAGDGTCDLREVRVCRTIAGRAAVGARSACWVQGLRAVDDRGAGGGSGAAAWRAGRSAGHAGRDLAAVGERGLPKDVVAGPRVTLPHRATRISTP
mmetsp:Transcript_107055/g.309620  ORF Transcript_107055/g.309620 Transcript_107055/m.309620 type:complete len:400 (-) Transcript_107055:1009-2208(-)